ncbi:hypothetical protein RCC89_14290 [Cytophagaceae bacterium ABcell3]|nr:hypothetical protein RCC89_14290 [Cytophagaceae bacterium ABcell3]
MNQQFKSMALKTSVLVRAVNNLSDARYCAGMGVDMLGFSIDPNLQSHTELKKVKDIAGWVAGVKLVAEVGDLSEKNLQLIKDTDPELILTESLEYTPKTDLPILLKVAFDSGSPESTEAKLQQHNDMVSGYVLENDDIENLLLYKDMLKKWCSAYNIFIGTGLTNENIVEVLEEINPTGISLKGGEEIRPGYKTFDELADILETIELDD